MATKADQPWPAALRAGTILALFAISGALLVALSQWCTKDRIITNQQAMLLQRLNELVPEAAYDNALLEDHIMVYEPELLGSQKPIRAYRARKLGQAVAVILNPVAPNGYNGSIYLLVAIGADGRLFGVRVVSHRETPGLGDGIENRRSSWIHQFSEHSLQTLSSRKWRVKREQGVFDQLTGATITSSAVIKAVHNCLLYFAKEKESLFAVEDEDRLSTTPELKTQGLVR